MSHALWTVKTVGGCVWVLREVIVGECWSEVNHWRGPAHSPSGSPTHSKGIRQGGRWGKTERSGPHPAAIACNCVQMYVSKKLQYTWVFIRLLNEPMWVCAPNFLALAVSQETLSLSLCTFLCLVLSGSVPMCVYVFIFECSLSNLHIHWLTRHRADPLPPPHAGGLLVDSPAGFHVVGIKK